MSKQFEYDVDQALEDAEFGIEQLRAPRLVHFYFYHRGTLVALKGVLFDYIWYEFADKFGFEIDEKSYEKDCKKNRYDSFNSAGERPAAFRKRHGELWGEALKDKRVEFLIGKDGERDLATHRHLNYTSARVGGGRSGMLYRDWEEDDSDIPTLCRAVLEIVRNIVNRLREEFPTLPKDAADTTQIAPRAEP